MFLFSRFFASWTPYFIKRYRTSARFGSAVGYYFFWWFVASIILLVLSATALWHFSAPEKVLPLFDRVPAFSFEFVDNELVKTSFPTDPYTISVYDEIRKFVPEGDIKNDIDYVYFSTKETTIPAELEKSRSIFFLRDGIMTTRLQNSPDGKKTAYDFGTLTIDNAFVKTKLQEEYPHIRTAILPFTLLIIPFFCLVLSVFYFVMSFFWSLVVWVISMMPGLPRLSYEESVIFVLHVFFPVMLLLLAFIVSGMYIPFLASFLFAGMLFYNTLGLSICDSHSTHKN